MRAIRYSELETRPRNIVSLHMPCRPSVPMFVAEAQPASLSCPLEGALQTEAPFHWLGGETRAATHATPVAGTPLAAAARARTRSAVRRRAYGPAAEPAVESGCASPSAS